MRGGGLTAIFPLLLIGCGPTIEPQQASTATPDAATPALAKSSVHDANAVWTISPDGFGPVRIGMKLEEASAALGAEILPAQTTDSPELCDLALPAGNAFPGLSFLTLNNRISNVRIFAPAADEGPASEIKTSGGIGLQSTEADIRAVYGSSVQREYQPYSGGDAFDLYVWFAPDRGIRYQLTPAGQVWAIHAGERSIRYWEGCL